MNYAIDTTAGIPAYLQIYKQLKNDIINGAYPCGGKIPSKRILTFEFGVSVITIQHALELLCEEGYLEARQRSGYYVIFRKEDFMGTELRAEIRAEAGAVATTEGGVLTSTVPMHTQKGDFPVTVLARTMRKVILDYGDKLQVKAPNLGCIELRQEICAYLARSRSIHVQPKQVVIGAGAEYLYGLIAQLFNGVRFAVENPSYQKIRAVYDAFHIRYDLLTLQNDGIDSGELKNTKAQILHTTPFHNYPTGISIGSSKKHEYVRWASCEGRYIIEDNYDSELTISSKPEESLFEISGGEKVLYLNTFSHTIAPSVRIGYLILPLNLLQTYHERLGFYSCPVPVFEQYVLTELLRNGDFERHINRVRRQKRKEGN